MGASGPARPPCLPGAPLLGVLRGGVLVKLGAFAAFLLPLAGDAEAQVARGGSGSDTLEVDPIRVTVLRTVTPVSSSPMAVSVLTEKALQEARTGAFLRDALEGIPGLQVQNRYNFAVGERLTIRGFGGRAQFGVRGVRVVVDGIPATLPDGQSTLDHLDLGSIGRVEVVRGPSSALFGNASGGVVSFETRAPPPSAFAGEIHAAGGSHGLLRTQATAGGTVGATGYNVSLSRQAWEGYRSADLEDVGRDSYGKADRLGLNVRVVRQAMGGELGLTVNALDLDAENPGSLARELMDDPERPAHGAGPFSNVARRTRKDLRQDQAGLRWEGPLGGLDADVSLFGVRRSMVNPIPSDIIVLDRDAAGLRGRLSGTEQLPWGSVQWHLGGEAELMFDDRLNYPNQSGAEAGVPMGDPTVDQRERVRASALYAQATLSLQGGGEGLVGLRYDRHDFRAWDHLPREPDEGPSATGEREMDALSPSVGMSLPLGENTHVFGNLGTVFETPSTTELGNRPDGRGGFNPDLEPQTGSAGELGVRGRIGALVTYEAAGFLTALRNELVRYQVEEFPGRDFFRNAGSSRHVGGEAVLSFASPGGILRGDVTYAYTDARFRSFEWDGESMDGNRIPGLAPHSARAAVRLRPAGWWVEAAGRYLHRVPVNDANTEFAPSWFLVDLRARGPEIGMGAVAFEPWGGVTNLFDRHYTASVVPNAFGARYYEPGPGRSVELGIRAAF